MRFELETVNAAVRSAPAELVRRCDEAYDAKIAAAADRIIQNLPASPVVLLAGPSGSGKTTTALRLRDELQGRGIISHSISMDNYYKTITEHTVPRTGDGKRDLESPLCLDMELLNAHFTLLSQHKQVLVPRFDFVRERRADEPAVCLYPGDNEVIIFEGIHGLNPAIIEAHPEAFKLYVSVQQDITDSAGRCVFKGAWMRLVRRLVRDYMYRGAEPLRTMRLWDNVVVGEKKYIEPYKDRADLLMDTAFGYECCVMRKAAGNMLARVPEGLEQHEEIVNAGRALERFVPLDAEYLPGNAMLREFVGGGIYEY